MTIPLSGIDIRVRQILVDVEPQLSDRNRLTCAFRPILAIPHVLLVGAPTAVGISAAWPAVDPVNMGVGTGVLGLVAGVCALIAWFAVLVTGTYPGGLWQLAVMYLRWRVRAVAYMALLRDEYPPFGDGAYPAHVEVFAPTGPRNRWTTAFRVFLLIPQFAILWVLSVVWLLTSMVAWLAILLTGRFPQTLYEFSVGMLRWSIRVEAYMLLLHDEYPPFTLEP
jgi:hypothetical protein